MVRAFVSVGSNVEPERNVREAIRRLASKVRVEAISTVYLTEPVGYRDQPPYYNCVVQIETGFPPLDLKNNLLRTIENEMGRIRDSDKFAPRTIDLDLILYGEIVMHEKGLALPDPDILKRPFLARALSELSPDIVIPGTAISIGEKSKKLSCVAMKPLASYTDMLREDLRHGLQP